MSLLLKQDSSLSYSILLIPPFSLVTHMSWGCLSQVATNKWEQTIEVGSATSVDVWGLSEALILQHLEYQACPLSAGDEGDGTNMV